LLKYFEGKGNPEMRPLIIYRYRDRASEIGASAAPVGRHRIPEMLGIRSEAKKGRVPDRADARRLLELCEIFR
jgi:hypothetical protein